MPGDSAVPPGEFGLIGWIRRQARLDPSGRVALGIGDDCAILRPSAGLDVVATTDMLMDGRHFRLGEASAEQVGYKALGVNLSDVAAMAAGPFAAFVSVALPRGEAASVAGGLMAGMAPLLDRFGVTLAGGDTNAWDGPLVVSITVLGEVERGRAATRSGARGGDVIALTGPIGGSLANGRHLRPDPRIFEARAIASKIPIRAMVDLSDGLASDLGHVLDESGGLGATLDESSLPIHPDAFEASRSDGRTPAEHALGDGEDFELCLAIDPDDFRRLALDPDPLVRLVAVGRVEREPGLRLRRPDGSVVDWHRKGFDHLGAGDRA